MIHYFRLPHDLYFWGQDRMGSLVALLAQVFYKGFGLSAVLSESITHYLILLAGFLAFSTFLRSRFYKVMFALIWFFPPMRLIDVTQFSFGFHYSLIAIACYLIEIRKKENVASDRLKVHLLLTAITILLITVIWVSDMALVSVFILVLLHFYSLYRTGDYKSIFSFAEPLYVIAGTVAGYFFIHYAKSEADVRQVYASFGSVEIVFKTIRVFLESLKDMFLFRSGEFFTSIYSWLAVLFISGLCLYVFRNKIRYRFNFLITFFILDASGLLAIIFLSEWTLVNDVPRRYFTCTYIALSFFIILVCDKYMPRGKSTFLLRSFLLVTIMAAAISTPHAMKYAWPGTLKPKLDIVAEFKQLGNAGYISNYWNSYVSSVPDPEMIKVTPHDQAQVRNQAIVNEVLNRENIYIIRDGWIETFPDTMIQFNHRLIKDGEEFYLGDCYLCKYRKESNR